MNLFTTAPKSVDGVLSAFKAAITDLNTVAAAQRDEAVKQETIAAAALSAKASAEAEATRATNIAAQMSTIFGG